MAKTKISEFSATPANNTDIDSINIAEGCAPSGINDAIRELMAQLKDFQTGAVGDSFNGPIGTSTAAAGAFTTLSASGTATLSGLTASTALALDASKNVVSVTNTGTGNNVLATSPTLVTPILGTPTSATLTNATGLPIATGVSGLGTGVATALAVNVGSAGAPVVNGGALGTPSSGTVTNLTGTASININGTVGATTPTTGAFTTVAASGAVTLSGGTANGVAYLNGSKVLTTGSALTFDGSTLIDTAADGTNNFKAKSTTGVMRFSGYIPAFSGALLESVNGAESGYAPFTTVGSYFAWNTGSEGMRLTSTGLGIGTSSLDSRLEINSSASNTARIRIKLNDTPFCYFGGYSGIVGSGNADDLALFAWTGKQLMFGTNATEKMRLDTAGNLGLGVTPSATSSGVKSFELQAVGSGLVSFGSVDTVVTAGAFYSSTGWKYAVSGSAVSKYYQSAGKHQWFNAASGTAGNAISFTQAMSLTAAGNLIVGDTTGNGKLSVRDSSAALQEIYTTAGTNYAALEVRNTGGSFYIGRDNSAGSFFASNTAYASCLYSSGAYPMVFFTNGTERARIDSSGNLLIGTTSRPSSAKLTVAGGLSVNNNTDNATSNNNYGNFFAKNAGSVSPSTTTTIKNATGSEAAMYLVSGVNSGLGIRFFDVVVTLTASVTPVVISTGSINAPPARTYSMSGENLQVNFGGADSFVIYVTGMGSNEA